MRQTAKVCQQELCSLAYSPVFTIQKRTWGHGGDKPAISSLLINKAQCGIYNTERSKKGGLCNSIILKAWFTCKCIKVSFHCHFKDASHSNFQHYPEGSLKIRMSVLCYRKKSEDSENSLLPGKLKNTL